ncbi:hypothetical protein NPIL_681841 [Nephila pilipes]|uniref:Endonuclease/exonuclease/phosphatase domain-containing protein n=1 Tax=Nephila pilipes TaxID=299642 RepID=A0A8X6PWK3_NEPPI|nr:hypothetical protein NPIL_681841 [Nephila pilipes]
MERQQIAASPPELQQFVIDNNLDIITLQETFLLPEDFFNISNYKIYRTDRHTHPGGGTALLIKKSIEHLFYTMVLEPTTINIETEVSPPITLPQPTNHQENLDLFLTYKKGSSSSHCVIQNHIVSCAW